MDLDEGTHPSGVVDEVVDDGYEVGGGDGDAGHVRVRATSSSAAFIPVIWMMIAPITFCTIVLGVGSIARAATVGKVGGLAPAYVMAMSTVALAIGLLVGHLIHPGEGLDIRGPEYEVTDTGRGDGEGGTIGFPLGIIPTTLLSSLTEGNFLQTLFVPLIVGLDGFLSEAQAVTNVTGDAVATLLIGQWTRQIDLVRVERVLSGQDAFDEPTMAGPLARHLRGPTRHRGPRAGVRRREGRGQGRRALTRPGTRVHARARRAHPGAAGAGRSRPPVPPLPGIRGRTAAAVRW